MKSILIAVLVNTIMASESSAQDTAPKPPSYTVNGDWKVWNIPPDRAALIKSKEKVAGIKRADGTCDFRGVDTTPQEKGTVSTVGEWNDKTCEAVWWHTSWPVVFEGKVTTVTSTSNGFPPNAPPPVKPETVTVPLKPRSKLMFAKDSAARADTFAIRRAPSPTPASGSPGFASSPTPPGRRPWTGISSTYPAAPPLMAKPSRWALRSKFGQPVSSDGTGSGFRSPGSHDMRS